ncbi:Z1 domain-containing protein [Paenibacillus contaminans]|uniref:Putative endonuclease Z1 domain-containing protein n=1 Tax=Paenibacillus contaminans TaxID=450362 RepID=A0A329MCN6_9BACL|nr:Z1 domain-containing protein [Paenibacillus contaminans]RAV17819.1 hypothetical protein DQG23_25745 [Paenibacillus contaminans]
MVINLDGVNVKHCSKFIEIDTGSEDAAKSVLKTAKEIMIKAPEPSNEEGKSFGLLYGLIQSGKTNIINMCIAIAADNGYKLFIVLTDNNTVLQNQTLERADDSYEGILTKDISTINNESPLFIKEVLKNEGVLLVCKKHPSDLNKLLEFIQDYDVHNLPTIVVDDEADAIGLNTNQRLENSPPSSINKQLLELSKKLRLYLYLQVTATPQAIILQDRDSGLSPEFIVMPEDSDGYIGIDTFFSTHRKQIVRPVNITEIEHLIHSDETENGLIIPKGMLKSLCSFMVAATIKIIEDNELKQDPSKMHYSYLYHISPFQKIHEKIKKLVDIFKTELYLSIQEDSSRDSKAYLDVLFECYKDIKTTYPNNCPNFDVVITTLRRNITSFNVMIINSSSHSEIKSSKKYNILIGGNKLGRGLTIPRLLTTYYGRNSSSPQVDTLLQHARMCGYRSNDLDVTRIFIPDELAELFEEISIHDQTQREIINAKQEKDTLYLDLNVIKPTRPNVIPTSVGAYKAGSTYFPKQPEYRKNHIENVTRHINQLILNKCKDPKKVYTVETSFATELINNVPILSSGGWRSKIIIQYISWYERNSSDKVQFLYILDSNIGKSKHKEGIGAVLSGNNSNVSEIIENNVDKNKPLLIMVRITGAKWEKEPFWIPLFKFPDNSKNILFNLANI